MGPLSIRFKEILIKYYKKDENHFIKINDILEQMDFLFDLRINIPEDTTEKEVEFFINTISQRNATTFGIMLLSMLTMVDLYLTKQIEYHGLHIFAAKETIEKKGFVDGINAFNSAKWSQIPTWEYYYNLLQCKKDWEDLTRDFVTELEYLCFPTPRKV